MANGWLGPRGEFVPCQIGKHFLKVSEIAKDDDIETWVHVTPSSCYTDLPLTIAQIEWIKKSGRKSYLADLEMMLEMEKEND